MLPIQYSKLGYHRASETPFKWRFVGGPMIARLEWRLDPSSPQKMEKSFFVNVGPPLTKLSGSAYADDSHAISNLIMFLKNAATCENVVF